MEGSFLALRRVNGLFQPLVEVFWIGRQPAAEAGCAPMRGVMSGVVHSFVSMNAGSYLNQLSGSR